MSSKAVEIKGTKEGLIIKFKPEAGAANAAELLNTLEEKLKNAQGFFKGANVQIISATPSPSLLKEAELLCQKYGLNLNNKNNEKEKIREIKIETGEGEKAMILWGDVRSGQRIDSKENLILLGNVHPGGEIRAKGDIFVWGSIWGSTFAGAEGDVSRIIIAFNFKPLNLAIAGISLKDSSSISEITLPSLSFTPLLAYVNKGEIDFKPYTG